MELDNAAGDTGTLFGISHGLKGTAATFGFIALQKAAHDVVEKTRPRKPVDVCVEIDRLSVEIDRAAAACSEFD